MIRSVVANVDLPFELLIGDASDEQGLIECADPRVQIVPEPEALGPPRGYNTLFRMARGDWVCWLNDDLELPPGWGDAVRAAIESGPPVDLFCLPMIEPGDPEALILLFSQIPYACMGLIRRDAGEAMGWFDEGYSFYATDPDLALRLVAADRRLAPAVGAHVLHHHLKDEERFRNRERLERDNARLARHWMPRIPALRRCYRRTSYRYFRNLEVRRSEAWRTKALAIPLAPPAEERLPAHKRRHRVKAAGWWLGV